MNGISIAINSQGHKQYVNDQDEDVCPFCHTLYTNEGEGVLCPHCEDEAEPVRRGVNNARQVSNCVHRADRCFGNVRTVDGEASIRRVPCYRP